MEDVGAALDDDAEQDSNNKKGQKYNIRKETEHFPMLYRPRALMLFFFFSVCFRFS